MQLSFRAKFSFVPPPSTPAEALTSLQSFHYTVGNFFYHLLPRRLTNAPLSSLQTFPATVTANLFSPHLDFGEMPRLDSAISAAGLFNQLFTGDCKLLIFVKKISRPLCEAARRSQSLPQFEFLWRFKLGRTAALSSWHIVTPSIVQQPLSSLNNRLSRTRQICKPFQTIPPCYPPSFISHPTTLFFTTHFSQR